MGELQLIAEVPLWARMVKEVGDEHGGDLTGNRGRYNAISRLIGYLMHELVAHSEKLIKDAGVESLADVRAHGKILIGYPEEVNRERLQLKRFLMENLYQHPRVERMRIKCRRILEALFPIYPLWSSTISPVSRGRADGARFARFLDPFHRLEEPLVFLHCKAVGHSRHVVAHGAL